MVRLAVVGTKGIGRGHIRAIRSVDGCELAAVCDANAAEAAGCGAEVGVPWYADLGEMIEAERLDGVTISTPHWSHPAVAIEAFEAGLHVLTEKPMAVTVGDADAMIRASENAGRILAVVFQERANPVNMAARRTVESGRLGGVLRTLLVNAVFRPEAYYRSDKWRGTWKGEGGGVLVNQAPHALDLLLWISGLVPESVTGCAETAIHGIEVEDRASALLRYPGGATGYLHVSTAEAPGCMRIEIAGERGRLVVDGGVRLAVLAEPLGEFSRHAELPFAAPGCTWEDVDVSITDGARVGHERVIEDFAQAIAEGRKPMVPGEEAIKSIEVANAIVLSSHRREPVALPVPRDAYAELMGLLVAGGAAG